MHLTGGIIFYIVGLAAAPYLFEHDLFIALPFVLAGIALLTRNNRFFPLITILFLFTFGLNQYFISSKTTLTEQQLNNIVTNNPVRIEGVVNSMNSRQENGLLIDLTSVLIDQPGKTTVIKGMVRIYVKENNAELSPGETIRLHTRIRKPRNFATPGGFDYLRYLTRRNIVATGFTNQCSNFARIHTENSWQPVFTIRKWRNQIRQHINNCITPEAAPFIKALAIGDRGSMMTSQRKLLAESGLAHLFAISGLHLGLVAGFLYLFFRRIYLRMGASFLSAIPPRRILPPLILPILLTYMILTGSAISTMRALIMLAAAVILCCFSRRSRPLDILVAAAFIILIFDPLALFEPSFQLSFAGAGGIILFLPFWQTRWANLPKAIRYPLTLLTVTLSASLATLPFVLLHFHILAPAGPLLNLAAVPLVSFVIIPLILIATLLMPVSLVASSSLFKVAGSILMQFMQMIEHIISNELLSAKMIYLTPATISITCLLLITAVCRKQLSRRLKISIITGVSIYFITTVWSTSNSNELRVTAFDVGQGDSTLIQTADGKNYLIDGGGLYSKTFDTGERLVAPALGYLGIKKLDVVILTHDHPDHRKGLIHILQHFPVNEFWSALPKSELHQSLLRILTERNIATRQFPNSWSRPTNNNILQVFVPDDTSASNNDRSLALYVRQGSDGILLTGDLEEYGVRQLASADRPGPVSLLKIPHHGSLKSDPSPLINRYSPTNSFISVGHNNRYGLPHQTVIDKLARISTALWRTDNDGSLRFVSNGHGWAITHWKKGLFR